MTQVAKAPQQLAATNEAEIIASLVINGDLSKLTQQQKVAYYKQFCERLGLDAHSQPFKLLRLNGKEILYCDRSGAQQLNKLHKVSHEIKAREIINGCYVVTAKASTPDGRCTESIGAVNIEGLKGETLCNAMMKAETKSKRRATLDLLGLGMLDETETEYIPHAEVVNTPVPSAVPAAPPPKQKPAEAPQVAEQFTISYDDMIDLAETIGKTKTLAELTALYSANEAWAKEDANVKDAFSKQKAIIQKK